MTDIIIIRTFENSKFEGAINEALEYSVGNTDTFLFGENDSKKMDIQTVYNAIRAHANANTTGIVIYHNGDGINKPAFNQYLAALKFISGAANVRIKVICQLVHKNGNPPTLYEYNLGF